MSTELTIDTVIEEFYRIRDLPPTPERIEVTPAVLGALKIGAVREMIGMVSLHIPVVLNPDLPEHPGWRFVYVFEDER